jgi:predicted HD phosphohydrolase
MRFLPEARIKHKWYDLREIGGKRTLKLAANEYYDSCSAVIKRCEALWQR